MFCKPTTVFFLKAGPRKFLIGLTAMAVLPLLFLVNDYSHAQENRQVRLLDRVAGEKSSSDGQIANVASRAEFSIPMEDRDARKKIGEILNQTTADLIQLRRITKQVHWNVTGQHFHAVHVSSDELADKLVELTDTVAERALALGIAIDGRTVKVSSSSNLADGPNGFTPDFMMVRLLANRLAKMSKLLGERIGDLDNVDLVAQDLLLDVKHVVDKYHWQFAVQSGNLNGE